MFQIWYTGSKTGKLYTEESLDPADLDRSEFRKVFDGKLLVDVNLSTIRLRVREQAMLEAKETK